MTNQELLDEYKFLDFEVWLHHRDCGCADCKRLAELGELLKTGNLTEPIGPDEPQAA